jgi:hypothetical protein
MAAALFWTIFGVFENVVDQFLFLYLVEQQLPDERPTLRRNAAALVVCLSLFLRCCSKSTLI